MDKKVNPSKVIDKLTKRIATLELEKAMLQVLLDESNEKGDVSDGNTTE